MQLEIDDQELKDLIYSVKSVQLNNEDEKRFVKLYDKLRLLQMARSIRL